MEKSARRLPDEPGNWPGLFFTAGDCTLQIVMWLGVRVIRRYRILVTSTHMDKFASNRMSKGDIYARL